MAFLDSPESAALTLGTLFFIAFVMTHMRANNPFASPKQLAHCCAFFGALPIAFLAMSLALAYMRPELYSIPFSTLLPWYLVAVLVIILMLTVTYMRIWNLPRYKMKPTPAF